MLGVKCILAISKASYRECDVKEAAMSNSKKATTTQSNSADGLSQAPHKYNMLGVITGDISNSQTFSNDELNHILDALKIQLSKYASQYGGNFDIYRGDAFQLAVTQPQHCMQIAIGIRLALKALPLSADVRVSAAIGEAQFRQQEVKIGTGEAFVLSGRGLDTIKPQYIAFSCQNEELENKAKLLTRFADAHISGLTQIQSQTVLAYLEASDKSHENIATILNKNRSNVSRILNASNYKLVAEYLSYMEEEIASWQQSTDAEK